VAVQDWSGPYAGLSYGRTSSDIDFNTTGLFDVNDGKVAGLYAGYLFQRGTFVYGGELAYGRVSDANVPGFPASEFSSILDLKGRAGVAVNRALFYGVIGYSKAKFDDGPTREFDMDGFAYGLGTEFAVTQRLTVGLEYMARDVSGNASDDATVTGDANLDTISLRVGLSF
jgi:opacity protein-like surface antigen